MYFWTYSSRYCLSRPDRAPGTAFLQRLLVASTQAVLALQGPSSYQYTCAMAYPLSVYSYIDTFAASQVVEGEGRRRRRDIATLQQHRSTRGPYMGTGTGTRVCVSRVLAYTCTHTCIANTLASSYSPNTVHVYVLEYVHVYSGPGLDGFFVFLFFFILKITKLPTIRAAAS